MKPTDVTDEILRSFRNIADELIVDAARKTLDELDKELVACAVNAFLGDPTPITAERLVARGWEQYGDGFVKYAGSSRDAYVYIENSSDGCVLAFCSKVSESISYFPPAKTIGQLRALEIGLGITQ